MFRILLLSTYELGHQPFGLASPAAVLERSGTRVDVIDLAVDRLDDEIVSRADLIAFYVPMHTATRLAIMLLPRVRALNPRAHLCFYGLYAALNASHLRGLGVQSILSGEFEPGLTRLAQRLSRQDVAPAQQEPLISLDRQRFTMPQRAKLPSLDRYTRLIVAGERRVTGYTEASRGCKHACRHCPVVPVYQGRFRIVDSDVVLRDVEWQVERGARHITFGDPDFLNGPKHADTVVRQFHRRFPDTTYDVTIKVEHLRRHPGMLPLLRDTGCLFITTAVESFDERVLTLLQKNHTADDFRHVLDACRSVGIAMNPTFIAFTPWTSLDAYVQFLEHIRRLDLIPNVAPVQYAVRLLIPSGSLLLELPEIRALAPVFNESALTHVWRHADPEVDRLQMRVFQSVQGAGPASGHRVNVFDGVWRLTAEAAGHSTIAAAAVAADVVDEPSVPCLSEPWFCCSEPSDEQLAKV